MCLLVAFQRYWSAWLLFHFSWRGRCFGNLTVCTVSNPAYLWKSGCWVLVWRLAGWQVTLEKCCCHWGRSSSKLIFPLYQWLKPTFPQSNFWEVLLKALFAWWLIANTQCWNLKLTQPCQGKQMAISKEKILSTLYRFCSVVKIQVTETANSKGRIILDSWVISYWCRRSCYLRFCGDAAK